MRTRIASRRVLHLSALAAVLAALAGGRVAGAQSETPAPTPDETATPPATETPVVAATATATATATPAEPVATAAVTPESTPTPAPTPRASGVGSPILFRGECTPGGGPAGCRIVAAGVVKGETLAPLPCADGEDQTRGRIAARYFHAGTPLDLYVRGAPAGTFVVAEEDEPPRGCSNRAKGRKVGAQGKVATFVALDPDDPVKLGALHFPSGVQPDARSVVVAAMKDAPFDATAQEIGVHEVRRLREGDTSVIVAEATTAHARSVVVSEGNGSDASGWKRVWASDPEETVILVDAFDLGADGKTEILLERQHRGELSEWILLRRDAGGWKPVTP
jgi:hypothetical protein